MPQFIENYHIPESLCDDILEFFYSKKAEWGAGMAGGGVDKTKKESMDYSVHPNHIVRYAATNSYCEFLFNKFLVDYINKYAYSHTSELVLYEGLNIQYYKSGKGFYNWHCEREGPEEPQILRSVVFMTYLNTVENGGTHFLHQDWTAKAIKGSTLLWPADFTFTHKGQIAKEDKYIITGWFSFPSRRNNNIMTMF